MAPLLRGGARRYRAEGPDQVSSAGGQVDLPHAVGAAGPEVVLCLRTRTTVAARATAMVTTTPRSPQAREGLRAPDDEVFILSAWLRRRSRFRPIRTGRPRRKARIVRPWSEAQAEVPGSTDRTALVRGRGKADDGRDSRHLRAEGPDLDREQARRPGTSHPRARRSTRLTPWRRHAQSRVRPGCRRQRLPGGWRLMGPMPCRRHGGRGRGSFCWRR